MKIELNNHEVKSGIFISFENEREIVVVHNALRDLLSRGYLDEQMQLQIEYLCEKLLALTN